MTALTWALTGVLVALWLVAGLRFRRPELRWHDGRADLLDADGARVPPSQPVRYRLHLRGGDAWIEVRGVIEWRLPAWADATSPQWRTLTVRVWNTGTGLEVTHLTIELDGPVYPGARLLVRVTP